MTKDDQANSSRSALANTRQGESSVAKTQAGESSVDSGGWREKLRKRGKQAKQVAAWGAGMVGDAIDTGAQIAGSKLGPTPLGDRFRKVEDDIKEEEGSDSTDGLIDLPPLGLSDYHSNVQAMAVIDFVDNLFEKWTESRQGSSYAEVVSRLCYKSITALAHALEDAREKVGGRPHLHSLFEEARAELDGARADQRKFERLTRDNKEVPPEDIRQILSATGVRIYKIKDILRRIQKITTPDQR